MRDADAWVGLFPEDVRVGDGTQGRAALRAWFDDTMRRTFTGTAHQIGNHIIEFHNPDEADGLVYSGNEHEAGDQWVVIQMMYFDRYERIDGRWLFRRRLPLYWYAADARTPPTGDLKMRWPGEPPTADSTSSSPAGTASGPGPGRPTPRSSRPRLSISFCPGCVARPPSLEYAYDDHPV